ncbi:Ferredoxin-6 [Zhongshania aliphaticivorans]|uniref:Ferredoxin-6 n=1 Tax=Zhongshania aliphaticivorans TaxID=1470434 RepID=A0A5S9Q3F7_9GAMM|nr:2Fe-2S iron-sulfur cluster-binding protein [Zhongshania aliphaticivorans]CAA0111398.1 Ferredoxin-6 [Zhongshania aliphaticivorans]CAA0118607.1 Ferredoxin-6 [Zhongshania aliphaticivorans]
MSNSIEFTFIDSNGDPHTVSATSGETLMSIATNNNIRGIDGDCGGCCACGTCRIHLDSTLTHISSPEQDELDIIEFAGDDSGTQRLGCQIQIDEAFAGKTIKVAQ